jgi:hypothetical protein
MIADGQDRVSVRGVDIDHNVGGEVNLAGCIRSAGGHRVAVLDGVAHRLADRVDSVVGVVGGPAVALEPAFQFVAGDGGSDPGRGQAQIKAGAGYRCARGWGPHD